MTATLDRSSVTRRAARPLILHNLTSPWRHRMRDIIDRLRPTKPRGDDGFTLIELLVVVVIIGVLVAIAVPVYLSYRQGAADKAAQSDARGAISAVEQYYTDNGNTYPQTATSQVPPAFFLKNSAGVASTLKVTLSDKTTLSYVNGGSSYKICSHNTDGNKYYLYDSNAGGSVGSVSGTLSMTTCT
jgi:type IV pilus assembly protein PilA